MPDITVSTLKFVKLPALAEAVKVKVAEIELPTAKALFWRFQVSVR